MKLFYDNVGEGENSLRAGGDPKSVDRSRVQQTPGEDGKAATSAVSLLYMYMYKHVHLCTVMKEAPTFPIK